MAKHWLQAYCLVACVTVLRRIAADETTQVADCPDGFQLFEASCYRLVSDPLTDGVSARTACQELAPNSHLVFVQSQSEQTFLQDLAKGQNLNLDYWMGLTFTDDVHHPHWLDASPLGNYSAWDRYGVFDEASPCVRLRRSSDYLWNDRGCHNSFGCICEIERNANDVVPLTTPAAKPCTPTPMAKSAHFKVAGPLNAAAPTDTYLLRRLQTPSLFRCATHCLQHGACVGFNYQSAGTLNKLLSFCELHSKAFSDDELTEKRGYKYYRMLWNRET